VPPVDGLERGRVTPPASRYERRLGGVLGF
jgi:hypothetical protein